MATKQAISTISYNTQPFLEDVLQRLIQSQVISFYAWIQHKGEYDERLNYTDKDHIHLYVEPNKKLDPMDLSMHFLEADPDNPRPLGVISWRTSNFAEWFLYNTHDPDYLAAHFETKQYQYSYEDFVSSHFDDFMNKVMDALRSASNGYARNKNLVNFLNNGGKIGELIAVGAISPSQASGYFAFAKMYNDYRRLNGFITYDRQGVNYVKREVKKEIEKGKGKEKN